MSKELVGRKVQSMCSIRQEGLKARRWARAEACARVGGDYLALWSEQAPGSRISSVLSGK